MVGRHSLGRWGVTAACIAWGLWGCSLDATEAMSSAGTAGSDSDGPDTGVVATSMTSADTTAGSASAASATGASSDSGVGPGTDGDTTSAVATGDSSTSEPATDSGSETSTGADPALVDCGLLTRHYLDEAAAGTAEATAFDASGNGVNLPLEYDNNMVWDEVGGNRGLRWQTAGQGGVPSASVDGTALAGLSTQTSATIEAVVQLQAVIASGSRIVHIGSADEGGRFTLAADDLDELHYRNYTAEYGNWPFDFDMRNRAVVHLVIDTTQPLESDRVRLFVNGVGVEAQAGGSLPPLNEEFQVGGRDFAIGNRANGSRSAQGMIFYAATYGCALTDAEVANNAAILFADDDTPP